jgi:Transposase IS4/DDE_Tnp_1-like zinc-ribbon
MCVLLVVACLLTHLVLSLVCHHLRMATSASSTRRSTRASQQPLSLAEEQANEVLSTLELRDVAAALRLSLRISWEDEDEEGEMLVESDEEEESLEEEEKKDQAAPGEEDDGWTTMLHDIDVPLPRLRLLQNRPPPSNTTPMQLFQHFIPQRLMEQFAHHTNAAAPHDWRHTTFQELYAFLGVHLFMGIDRLPSIEMYWSRDYQHSTITSIFSRDRFKQLRRYFRIVPAPVDAAPRNPIPHVRALAEKLNRSFAAHFIPIHHLSLDEAMVAYKGRSSIKQYIPSKPHKWGYKIYCLASEDYLLHFEVYEGKEDDPSESGSTYDTVIRMTQQYQNQQLILFTDNWFTSPTLMNALKERGIRMCGSVRSNRKGMPTIHKHAIKALSKGEYIRRQKDDICLAVWKDQKAVQVLFNHVSPRATTTLDRWTDEGERISIGCPKAIRDYFYHARSVDVLNQLHYSYPIGRKARRCWPRLAWWLLDMCIINAFKLWSMGQPRPNQLDFREQLMRQLLKQLPENQMPRKEGAQHPTANALAKDHYSILSSEERDCKQCSRRPDHRQQTNYVCNACAVHLCLGDCFHRYHTRV